MTAPTASEPRLVAASCPSCGARWFGTPERAGDVDTAADRHECSTGAFSASGGTSPSLPDAECGLVGCSPTDPEGSTRPPRVSTSPHTTTKEKR